MKNDVSPISGENLIIFCKMGRNTRLLAYNRMTYLRIFLGNFDKRCISDSATSQIVFSRAKYIQERITNPQCVRVAGDKNLILRENMDFSGDI